MKSRFKRRTSSTTTQLPEVCLTPLIDAALTLLVIFMVATPMIQNALKVDLPEGSVNQVSSELQRDLVVSLDQEEKIYVNDMPTSLANLEQSVQSYLSKMNATQKKRVWIAVDQSKTCSAAAFIKIMDIIKGIHGIEDLAILTKKPTAVA